MSHPKVGQSVTEFLLLSLWIVVVLAVLRVPERLTEGIRGRLERTEAVLRLPVP